MRRWTFFLPALFVLPLYTSFAQAQLGAATATTQPANTDGQIAVPVRRVVLFSSGVGYFQHAATVTGNASTELRFKNGQINDILKSLVLEDQGGGTVGAVTYPSQDPVGRTLKSFQVDITANPSLADLLNQLRGAKVTAMVQGQQTSGTVLGVEKRQIPVGDKGMVDEMYLNLLAGASIKIVPLADVRDVQLDDAKLQAELEKALAALSASRDQDKKPVTIAFRSEGERQVLVGYVVETPVWKTSYRLILDGKADKADAASATQPADKGGMGPLPGKATLQGWAIVENQTDNDWDGIELSLVSGRPISFVQDLYSPLYIPRPVVQPDVFASLTPQTYEAGDVADLQQAQAQMGGENAAAAAPGAIGGIGGGFNSGSSGAKEINQLAKREDTLNDAIKKKIDPGKSVASAASANKLGELFQYTIRDKVNLPRQKSAMIPIVEDPIEIERVSIYDPTVMTRFPLNGARLKNTTGKHLLAGPVTVFNAGSYAGDARIDDVPPGQERLVSFGIDLDMPVSAVNNRTTQQFMSGKIVKGVLELVYKQLQSQGYEAHNKSDHDKTLIIEHPVHPEWKLVDTMEPAEKTDAVYRFKLPAPAGKTTKLTVSESLDRLDVVQILPTDPGTIDVYVRNGEIPAKVRDALAKAAELKCAVVDTQRHIVEDHARINDINVEQKRMDETLKTIGQTTELYGRLMKKMDDAETQLDKLNAEILDLTKQQTEQQKALDDYIGGLNVE